MEFFSQNLILILIFAFWFLLIFLIIFLILKREKTFETLISKLTENSLFLEVSNAFKEEVEVFLKKELEKATEEMRELTKTSLFEIASYYHKQIENLNQVISTFYPQLKSNLSKKIEELNKELDISVKEVKKEMAGFQRIKEKVEKEISKETAIILNKLEAEAKNYLEEVKKNIFEVMKSISKEAKGKIDFSTQNLEREIKEIYEKEKRRFEEKLIQTEIIIENYKKEKLKEIDEKIFQILNEVAKKTLAKGIDLSTHEELVIKALERAKKEHFL